MDRKFSIPCCFCRQRKNCNESFLCSRAFVVRLVLSVVAAVGLVLVMQQIFPQVFSSLSPDSYSVTGHPMDKIVEKAPPKPAAATDPIPRATTGDQAVNAPPTNNSWN